MLDLQKPTNLTSGNINFQLTQNGNTTRLKWSYTDNTPITNYKIVEMDFTKGNLVSFGDTWSIYKIGPLNALTAEQAKTIALNAAQKVTLNFEDANGTIYLVNTPDLTNAPYQIQLDMYAHL